jgi:hypothetical protein
MAETVCLTMMREQMPDVRWKADTRDQPGSVYRELSVDLLP